MYLMSAPATNAFSPAPVRTTTRTSVVVRAAREAVAQLGERRDVERVQRVLAVDRDDGDAVVALRRGRHAAGPASLQEVDDLARSARPG